VRRETLGGVLFFAAVALAVVLEAAGVIYGWPVVGVLVLFVAGCLLLTNA
jgi:hypothetical protein